MSVTNKLASLPMEGQLIPPWLDCLLSPDGNISVKIPREGTEKRPLEGVHVDQKPQSKKPNLQTTAQKTAKQATTCLVKTEEADEKKVICPKKVQELLASGKYSYEDGMIKCVDLAKKMEVTTAHLRDWMLANPNFASIS